MSYAEPDDPWFKRQLIGLLEFLSGKPKLEQIARKVLNEPIRSEKIMGAALRELKIELEIDETSFYRIPIDGPLIFISNHPFGVVDGLALCEIVSRVRSNYAILVNSVLCREPRLGEILLPIDFREKPEAVRINLKTRQEAVNKLAKHEAVAIFPSGAVATAPFPGKPPVDLEWKRFVIRMITQSNATVIPVYFHGNNSFWFQLASYLHMNLRLGLLLYEVRNKMGTTLKVSIGNPITPKEWLNKDPLKELLPFLRETTMNLGSQSLPNPPNLTLAGEI
ncbi:MAG: lysophospholipid acyltransferase family protein [Bacteroidota bacterium]